MPTYDYECTDCRHVFEHFQSITSDPLTDCPTCKGNLRRLIGGGGGIIFKGSGFYQTDYRSADYKAKAAAAEKAHGDSSEACCGGSGKESTTTTSSKASSDG